MPNENAISNYNSLQATIEQRLSHGLNFNFNYVWSHFLDDLDSAGWGSHSGTTNWQNAYNPSANYGNSNFDVRNAFKGFVLYQLPFGRGRQFLNNNALLDAVIGGWQVSDTAHCSERSTLYCGDEQRYQLVLAGGSDFAWYPNVIGNPKLANRGINQWFNEAAFAVPARGNLWQRGAESTNRAWLTTINLSLVRHFHIWEQVKLQIRADADNLFNHPSFGLPNAYRVPVGAPQVDRRLLVAPRSTVRLRPVPRLSTGVAVPQSHDAAHGAVHLLIFLQLRGWRLWPPSPVHLRWLPVFSSLVIRGSFLQIKLIFRVATVAVQIGAGCVAPIFAAQATNTTQAHERKAQEYVNQKQPKLAIPEFKAVLAADPNNLNALANLGVLLYFEQDYAEAAPYLKQAVAKRPA